MTLLGLFALAQVLAVFIHFLPALRTRLLVAGEDRPAVAHSGTRPMPSPAEPESVQPTSPAQDPVVVARASQLVSEADRLHRIGDFEGSLGLLKQAEAMLPSTPEIQFRIGQALEGLGENGDAYLAYEKSVSVPGLSPDVRRQAEQKMALLTQALAGSPSSAVLGGGSRPAVFPNARGGSVREPNGLQPGAALGIIDARLQDSQPGAKTLRIAVKSREGLPVDTRLVNVHVYFYEKDEFGEVMVTESKPTTQWISPPIDWSEAEPELLDIEYALPDGGLPGNSGDMGAPGRSFFGYVVGVYYNNELQDARSEPPDLQGRFPLKLNLSQ
ncbi:MAG: hypothetical protein Fur0032_00460 [Terrimicrobiaceae bacterium]